MSGSGSRSFRECYEGWLSGLLSWQDFDTVFRFVKATAGDGWWVYDTRGSVPVSAEQPGVLLSRLDEIEAFLRRYHKADYCGFVYADDRASPSLVKVYDPRNASSCSLGTPVPVFTISRMPPDALPYDTVAPATSGILGRIFKGAS